MLKKISSYLGICLFTLSVSQCFNKCKVAPYQDTTDLILVWQEESKPLEVSGLDWNKDDDFLGKTCYVPSEDATYFINNEGNAWKFTRDEAGDLKVNSVAKLPEACAPGEMFAFQAGTKEEQALFVGKLTSGPTVISGFWLWKQESNNWQLIFSASTAFSSLLPINANCFGKVGACSLEDDQQINGCLLLPLLTNANLNTAVLIFDASSKQFKVVKPHLARDARQYPVEAISPAPNKLIIGYGDPGAAKSFSLINLADDKTQIIPKELNNMESAKIVGSFTLQLNTDFLVKDPIFYALYGDSYQFMRLNGDNHFVSAGGTPITLNKKTLILPFAKDLYCVTSQDIGEGKKQGIYYQATLDFNTSQPENKK